MTLKITKRPQWVEGIGGDVKALAVAGILLLGDSVTTGPMYKIRQADSRQIVRLSRAETARDSNFVNHVLSLRVPDRSADEA